MKNTIKLAEKIPFTQSFTSKLTKKGLSCKKVIRNLGPTFYPRLIAIYNNLIESFVVSNNYLKTAAIPQLASQLARRRDYVRLQGVKMKINDPPKKLLGLKNYILPETVYRNDNFYISVVCRVYFGSKFNPFGEYSWSPSERIIKLGKYRYLVWNKQKSLGQNLSNMYNQQIYEFVVKVESNYYINLFNTQSTDAYKPQKIEVRYDQDQFQDMVATELVLRSSSQQFDWILYDVNGIMRIKYKK